MPPLKPLLVPASLQLNLLKTLILECHLWQRWNSKIQVSKKKTCPNWNFTSEAAPSPRFLPTQPNSSLFIKQENRLHLAWDMLEEFLIIIH